VTTVVTGGAGFIGSYILANLLDRGESAASADVREIAGEQRTYLGPRTGMVKHIPCDVTSLSSVLEGLQSSGADRVIHSAGVMWGDHRRVLELNLQGTLNVLEACRLLQINKVVCFSSVGVLAPAQYEPLDTSHPLLLPQVPPFNGFYSASKIAAEATAWAYTTTFGMDVTVVRPCTVYGFGESPALRIRPMLENALAGEPTRFPDGREVARSYTHAADVAEVAVLSAFHNTGEDEHRIFFAGTDGPLVTLGEIAQMVEELVPGADISLEPELTEAQTREGHYRRPVDITTTREQLGFKPKFASMQEGLSDSVDRYRALRGA